MNRKLMGITSIAAMLLMIGIAAWVGNAIPADMALPVHWDIHGEPNRFAGKWTALLMPVLVAGGVSLLFFFLPALETREKGLQRSRGLYVAVWSSLLLLSIMVQLAIVSVALHWDVQGTAFILAAVGLLLVITGNQAGKSRGMYLIGIRTPWTLASEDVWIKTHRLAGKLMVFGGLLLLVAAFPPIPSAVIAALMVSVIGAVVLIPAIYSFVLYRRERAAGRTA